MAAACETACETADKINAEADLVATAFQECAGFSLICSERLAGLLQADVVCKRRVCHQAHALFTSMFAQAKVSCWLMHASHFVGFAVETKTELAARPIHHALSTTWAWAFMPRGTVVIQVTLPPELDACAGANAGVSSVTCSFDDEIHAARFASAWPSGDTRSFDYASYTLFWTLRTACAMTADATVARPSLRVLCDLAGEVVAQHHCAISQLQLQPRFLQVGCQSAFLIDMMRAAAAHWIHKLTERAPTTEEAVWQAGVRAHIEQSLAQLSLLCCACRRKPDADAELLACQGCGVCYCGVACQRAHRKEHKQLCFRAPILL